MKEDTLLRKLVSDGEGIGEDRKLQQLSIFFRESRKPEEIRVPEAVKAVKFLEMLELSMLKQKQIAQMNSEETNEFGELAVEFENEIENMYEKMDVAKKALSDAKIIKKNRQEYRKRVVELESAPSRSDSMRRLEEVKEDLLRQHDRQKLLESKLSDRRNHLQAFSIILENFRRFITDDDEEGSTEIGGNEMEENGDSDSGDENAVLAPAATEDNVETSHNL